MRDSLTSLNVSSSNQNKAVFFPPIRIKQCFSPQSELSWMSVSQWEVALHQGICRHPIRIKPCFSRQSELSWRPVSQWESLFFLFLLWLSLSPFQYIRKNYSITYDFISENNHVLKSNTLHCFLYGVTISTRNKHTDSNRYKNAFSICIMYITIADNKWQGGKKLFCFFLLFLRLRVSLKNGVGFFL